MIIQHNPAAQHARRKLEDNTGKASKSLQRLASGCRINSAADDAANLAISEKLRFYITGTETGIDNATQGLQVSQVGDSALGEVQEMLRRIYELAEQSSNGTYSSEERELMNKEVSHLITEIDRVAKYTQVNHVFPLNFESMGITAVPPSGGSSNDGNIDFDDIELGAFLNSNGALTGSGNLNLAGVTTAASGLDKIWDLVYNAGNTSHTKIRLYTNGSAAATDDIDLRNCAKSNYTSVTDPISGKITYSLTYKYTKNVATGEIPAPAGTLPADLIDIDITQHIAVNPKEQDSQYYSIAYDIANNNVADGPAISYDFMHQFDTAYNDDDQVERYYINGNRVENSTIYSNSAASGLPPLPTNGFSIWGPTSELSFTGSVQFGTSQPDNLFLGHWSQETPIWDYIDDPSRLHGSMTPGTDLGFSMVWKGGGFNADGTSTKRPDLKFGIVRKTTDTNIDTDDNVADPAPPPAPVPAEGIWIQSGADAKDGFYLRCCTATAEALGITNVTIATIQDSSNTMDKMKDVINTVSEFRGMFGADQNRIAHVQTVNSVAVENLTASESSIRDVDMAKEHMTYVKNSLLAQASQAMLAQAQQMPQRVMELLK